MSPNDNRGPEGRFSGLTNALRRRQSDRLEIDTFHVGDVRVEKPLLVKPRSIIAGDVLAPEVEVSGVIYGFVACRRLVVAPGGQIWGDVYVSSVDMAPTGKINGWISTLDAGTVDLLRAGELNQGDLPEQASVPQASGLLEQLVQSGAQIETDQKQGQRRTGIWRQLRSEAALALLARSEIEATFDQRLDHALTESAAEIAGLQKALEAAEAAMAQEEADDATVTTSLDEQSGVSEEGMAERAEIDALRAQLRQATAVAQKYYGELLWTRAALRAARRASEGP